MEVESLIAKIVTAFMESFDEVCAAPPWTPRKNHHVFDDCEEMLLEESVALIAKAKHQMSCELISRLIDIFYDDSIDFEEQLGLMQRTMKRCGL